MIIYIHVGELSDELGAQVLCTPEPQEAKWSGDKKEDLKKIRKRGNYQATLEVAGWKVTFICNGYARAGVGKTVVVRREKDKLGPAFGRTIFLRNTHVEGTLRLKLKKKSAEAEFFPDDLTAKFWLAYGISEILPLKATAVLSLDYWGQVGTHWEIRDVYADVNYTKKFDYTLGGAVGHCFDDDHEPTWALAVMQTLTRPMQRRLVAYSNLPHRELEQALEKRFENYPIKMLLYSGIED